ncbi:MAG: DUF1572 family protein [Bacteroidota bacterium]
MITATLKSLFNRDLLKLKAEIESYQKEENLWRTDKGIANSAGNLCLHLVGNLNAYIGVGLAKTGYIRQRDLEFSLKDIPKAELIQRIEEVIIVVETGLNNLHDSQMGTDFPIVIWENPTQMLYTLIHLSTHLNYHLGQVNYHRRLLDSGN